MKLGVFFVDYICLGLYWVYIFFVLFGFVLYCCVYLYCWGVFVLFGGVRDILNARAIYLQIEEAWA